MKEPFSFIFQTTTRQIKKVQRKGYSHTNKQINKVTDFLQKGDHKPKVSSAQVLCFPLPFVSYPTAIQGWLLLSLQQLTELVSQASTQ